MHYDRSQTFRRLRQRRRQVVRKRTRACARVCVCVCSIVVDAHSTCTYAHTRTRAHKNGNAPTLWGVCVCVFVEGGEGDAQTEFTLPPSFSSTLFPAGGVARRDAGDVCNARGVPPFYECSRARACVCKTRIIQSLRAFAGSLAR